MQVSQIISISEFAVKCHFRAEPQLTQKYLRVSPSIMSVQYTGGCSVHQGDIMSTLGGSVQYAGGLP